MHVAYCTASRDVTVTAYERGCLQHMRVHVTPNAALDAKRSTLSQRVTCAARFQRVRPGTSTYGLAVSLSGGEAQKREGDLGNVAIGVF